MMAGMEKLRAFLDTRELTGLEFATESGISPAALSRILTGKTKRPELETVLRIQDATAGAVSISDWPRA